jgi:hypothetical protein
MFWTTLRKHNVSERTSVARVSSSCQHVNHTNMQALNTLSTQQCTYVFALLHAEHTSRYSMPANMFSTGTVSIWHTCRKSRLRIKHVTTPGCRSHKAPCNVVGSTHHTRRNSRLQINMSQLQVADVTSRCVTRLLARVAHVTTRGCNQTCRSSRVQISMSAHESPYNVGASIESRRGDMVQPASLGNWSGPASWMTWSSRERFSATLSSLARSARLCAWTLTMGPGQNTHSR